MLKDNFMVQLNINLIDITLFNLWNWILKWTVIAFVLGRYKVKLDKLNKTVITIIWKKINLCVRMVKNNKLFLLLLLHYMFCDSSRSNRNTQYFNCQFNKAFCVTPFMSLSFVIPIYFIQIPIPFWSVNWQRALC